MLEIDKKIDDLIKLVVYTYALNRKEAIAFIINKIKNYEL